MSEDQTDGIKLWVSRGVIVALVGLASMGAVDFGRVVDNIVRAGQCEAMLDASQRRESRLMERVLAYEDFTKDALQIPSVEALAILHRIPQGGDE